MTNIFLKLELNRTSRPGVFCKKALLKISQNSQENTHVNVSFYRAPLVAAFKLK